MSKLKIKSKNKFCFASEFEAARLMGGFSVESTAKICCRDSRTIRDWLSGAKPCPAWALRLIVLESRYMDALYRLQTPRAYESMHLARGMAANQQVNKAAIRLIS
ncbi:hypothetical protein [Noviherbaspirillum sedimenti]|uniref:Uncharacterized protein n=1 Tax=Noviherbaspirillum sedimenti TaxID=2320865 RepID=A0A3A3GFC7_9BURK|nr:hypothetical protein [Noviherbaspirillum sedimenti]RJG00966.1 hypothetical protein D3878_04660 [Noviherbaspirillum sedimenti]